MEHSTNQLSETSSQQSAVEDDVSYSQRCSEDDTDDGGQEDSESHSTICQVYLSIQRVQQRYGRLFHVEQDKTSNISKHRRL
jgi:hypothetical protein